MTPIERVVQIARDEVGYLEKKTNANLDDKTANAGNNNWTKYARDLDNLGVYNGKKNGYSWCDIFVDWCFIKAFGLETAMKMTNQQMKGYGAGCTDSARYYKAAGRFFTNSPQVGDQIFFSQNKGETMYHTGLVVAVKNGMVYTIEGNTSSEKGVVENGGCVATKSYNLNYAKIGGYGRPNYSLVQEEDDDMDLTKWTDADILQLAQRIQTVLAKQPISASLAPELEAAKGAAITDGTSPNAFCTRAQAAVMVTRAMKK